MTRSHAERIERSFKSLAHRGEELADRCFALLFARNPHLRALFPASLYEQKQQLLTALASIAWSSKEPMSPASQRFNPGWWCPVAQAEREHFPLVRDTLVEVLQSMAAAAWSDQLAADWTRALDDAAGMPDDAADAVGSCTGSMIGSS